MSDGSCKFEYSKKLTEILCSQAVHLSHIVVCIFFFPYRVIFFFFPVDLKEK